MTLSTKWKQIPGVEGYEAQLPCNVRRVRGGRLDKAGPLLKGRQVSINADKVTAPWVAPRQRPLLRGGKLTYYVTKQRLVGLAFYGVPFISTNRFNPLGYWEEMARFPSARKKQQDWQVRP